MRRIAMVAALGAALVGLACGGAVPQTVTSPEPAVALAEDSGGVTASAGMTKTAISGLLDYVSQDPPGRAVLTPSDMCHFWDYPIHDYFYGDVHGPVTFFEQGHGPCDFTHIAGSGPFEAEVEWNGRSGRISGQWTTNCKPDPVTVVSCDGTMNARGEGGLDGVQFHFKWGPGFYPFNYTGWAFSK